jgi:hypothetical protein
MKAIQGPEKFVHNLSQFISEPEELVVKRRLNFAVINRVSNPGVVCVAESARFEHPPC